MDIKHVFSFTAAYEDGTFINQNEEDKSETDETKSRFFDVLEKAKESQLFSFVIHNENQTLGVDLRDGHFELNGIPFFQHRPELKPYKDFRIIYYRTVEQTVSQDGTCTGTPISYTVGWQVTHAGKNVERTVTI